MVIEECMLKIEKFVKNFINPKTVWHGKEYDSQGHRIRKNFICDSCPDLCYTCIRCRTLLRSLHLPRRMIITTKKGLFLWFNTVIKNLERGDWNDQFTFDPILSKCRSLTIEEHITLYYSDREGHLPFFLIPPDSLYFEGKIAHFTLKGQANFDPILNTLLRFHRVQPLKHGKRVLIAFALFISK